MRLTDNKTFLAVLALSVSGMLAISCVKDKVEPTVPVDPMNPADTTGQDTTDTNSMAQPISYSAVIEPLMNINCATSFCHDDGTGADGKKLTNHARVSSFADEILLSIQHDPASSAMPQGASKLPDSSITHFDTWIKEGKLNN